MQQHNATYDGSKYAWNVTRGNKNDVLGYWASQEQYSMQDLLKFVAEAEKGGFSTCLTSDHLHPWLWKFYVGLDGCCS